MRVHAFRDRRILGLAALLLGLAVAAPAGLAGGTRPAPPRPPSGGGGHPGGGGGHPGGGGGHPGGGGGHHGGGYYGGGHYGGRYYGGYYRGYYGGYWGPYWGSYWGPYWGYWGPSVVVYGGGGGGGSLGRFGVVDADVQPEEAELWLDGKLIGRADDFDGFPDYLYLLAGEYKLELKHPRYEPLSLDLKVRRGQLLQLNDELQLKTGRGRLDAFDDGQEIGTPLGRFFGPNGQAIAMARPPEDADDEADVRVDRRDEDEDEDEDVEDREEAAPKKVEKMPAPPPERARLRWKVTPDDAAVYLDDRYLGTAEDVNASPRGTVTEPGWHTVVVVRPGYKARTFEVESKPGKAIDVVVELEK